MCAKEKKKEEVFAGTLRASITKTGIKPGENFKERQTSRRLAGPTEKKDANRYHASGEERNGVCSPRQRGGRDAGDTKKKYTSGGTQQKIEKNWAQQEHSQKQNNMLASVSSPKNGKT